MERLSGQVEKQFWKLSEACATHYFLRINLPSARHLCSFGEAGVQGENLLETLHPQRQAEYCELILYFVDHLVGKSAGSEMGFIK